MSERATPRQVAAAWSELRGVMIRERPADFTRDEWAYLIQFLAEDSLAGFIGAALRQSRLV